MAPGAPALHRLPGLAGAEQPPLQVPGRTAPTAGLLVAAAIGALILGAAAIFVFYQGRAAALRPDAAPGRDASELLAPDAATPAALAPDARVPASGEPVLPPLARDAGPPPPPHDAAVHPRPGARDPGELTTRADAGAAHPTGTATLTVGAIPWGTVLLDGKPIGRTPIDHLSVPAGHHTINVTFGGADPPRTLSYTVDLGTGETKDLVADFTQQ